MCKGKPARTAGTGWRAPIGLGSLGFVALALIYGAIRPMAETCSSPKRGQVIYDRTDANDFKAMASRLKTERDRDREVERQRASAEATSQWATAFEEDHKDPWRKSQDQFIKSSIETGFFEIERPWRVRMSRTIWQQTDWKGKKATVIVLQEYFQAHYGDGQVQILSNRNDLILARWTEEGARILW